MTASSPSPARLRALLKKLPGKRVLVVGDIILDEYLSGEVRRISPEAPIPVFELRKETATPGAGAYVASLLRHLGAEVALCGVVGEDSSGMRLRGLLRTRGISTDGLLTDASRPTTVKTRVISQNQQMIRIDRERIQPIPPALSARLGDFVRSTSAGVDAVIVSDYDKGTLSPSLIRTTVAAARRARRPIAVNPKPPLAMCFRGATFISMNHFEASACLRRPLTDETDLKRGGRELRSRLGARAVLITRREQGMALFSGGKADLIPTRAKEVFDGTGAGDTVVSVVALGLAAGGRLMDSVHLANAAAGVEVGKLGCALVSASEISRSL